MGNRPPAQWLSPTIGTVLRMAFGEEHFRLQFVSVAVGLVWFAWYAWKKRRDWNWTEQLPVLLLVSFVTAPYGAWPFDMVLLMPAAFVLIVKSLAAWKAHPGWALGSPRFTLAGLVAINLGCLVLNLFQIGSFWFLWVAPVMLLLYAIHVRGEQRTGGSRPPLAGAAVCSPQPVTVPV
jgi:hypothetical protein